MKTQNLEDVVWDRVGNRWLTERAAAAALGVSAVISMLASLIPTHRVGVTAANYSKPLKLGEFRAFGSTDFALYAARQACK
jgi:hypothetical protein